jgi:hypothetical protein
MYIYADEHGDPDFSRPVPQHEQLRLYWSNVDSEPQTLAGYYLDFHVFSRVEFILFEHRLSASILVARSARAANGHLQGQLEQQKQDGSHIVPGWEAESEGYHEDSIGVVEDAQKISIGATILTAVAALELLLKELSPEGDRRSGLDQFLRRFLTRHNASPDTRSSIVEMTSEVRRHRNAFAHTLTGSYWDPPTEPDVYTWESMEKVLFTVGRIAILLEDLIDRSPSG